MLFADEVPNLWVYVSNDPQNLVDPTGQFANSLVGALTGVVSGYLMAEMLGECYGLGDLARDAALGAVGAGIASKANKLLRLAKLRDIARLNGMVKTSGTRATEVYRSAEGYLELAIKPVPAGPNTGQLSQVPRASLRIDAGKYLDPFTGDLGTRTSLPGHIPLEPYNGGLAGAASGALGGCRCNQ